MKNIKRNILIVDDQEINRELLKLMLHNEYNIIEAQNGFEAVEKLKKEKHDIAAVLMDVIMPEMNGFDALKKIREDENISTIPVIIVTGSTDESSRVHALELGANDFILKPYNADIIKHCLENNIALYDTSSLINDLRHDKLTGLLNREAFFEMAGEMVLEHTAGYYVMAAFDVDSFKVINDQYGIKKGDDVLRHIATTFKNGFGQNGGLCCRVSADNFAVLYPLDYQETNMIAELRKKSCNIDGLIAPLSFSIGRYVIDDLSLLPSAMYDRAVLAAETVKGRFDETIAVYKDSMREHFLVEQKIVMEMQSALKDNQFEAWYQPQYNHNTGALIGSEALARWRHPQNGLIPPGKFIPVFEKNGFVYELDKYIWEDACRHLRKWIDEGRDPLPVSVNISRYDIFRGDLVDVITELIKKYSLPVEMLRLEVTESAFSKSASQIISVIKKLIDFGFTVEIDDFGSGYSSLNTLKDVPAQVLKLDMKFLESSENSQRGGNIVESIVRMAKWLGMSIIAEGVETVRQADFLKSIGCNYIQGYLYSKPIPADEFEKLSKFSNKEEKLLVLETAENLDNNSFWDPDSLDTLIFNSYVGGACIYEYNNGKIELIRVTEKYAQVISSAGMTIEDALKLDWFGYFDSDTEKKIKSDLELSIRTKKEVTGEYVFTDLPGCPHETYLRLTMRVIASAGNRYLIYCTNENITAQRRAEQKERQSVQQLQTIMSNMNGGFSAITVGKNGKGTVVFANDKYYELFGYTKEQMESELDYVSKMIHPDDRKKIQEQINKTLHDRVPCSLKYRCVRRDGRVIYVRGNKSVANIEGYDSDVLISVVNDITEFVKTEQRAERLSDQLKSIMDNVDQGITATIIKDRDVSFLFANNRYFDLLGYTKEQYEKEIANPYFTIAEEDRQRALMDTAKMNKIGLSDVFEYRVVRRNGELRNMRMAISVGKITGVEEPVQLAIFRDITLEKKAETDRKELLDNIPHGAALFEFDGKSIHLIHINKSYWELIDRDPYDYTDSDINSVVCSDDMNAILKEITASAKQKRDAVGYYRMRYGENEHRPFHVVAKVLPKENGKYSVYATFTPISNETMSYEQMMPFVLSTILNSTSDLSFAKDEKFRYTCASHTFIKLVGLSSINDIVGKTDFDIFDIELANKYRHDDEMLFGTGKSIVDMVEEIPSSDGIPCYSCTSKYLLRDSYGKIIGLYGVGRDITEYKDAYSRLKLVTSSIPGGLATYVCTEGGFTPEHVKITYFNDGFCRLFGFNREEYERLSNLNPMSMIFEDDRNNLSDQWHELMKNNKPINCLYRVHIKDGSFKWISHKAVASDRQDGRVIINAMLQDITSNVELMEKLRISEEENSLAVKLGGNIVCRYDVAERSIILDRDLAKSTMLPEKISGVPDKQILDGIISEDTAAAYRGFFEAINSGCKIGTVIFSQKNLKEWRWLEAKGSTVFSTDGKPVKAVICFNDITDQMEKENIYIKWQQSLAEKPKHQFTLFRCNLSRDTSFDIVEGALLNFDFSDEITSFNKRTREYVDHFVYDGDKDRYIAFMNADILLAGYYRGKRTCTLEYREIVSKGCYRWLKVSVDLVEYPNSTEVEAFMMYEDIDEEKREKLRTKELAENDPLTRVFNRMTFAAKVNSLIHSSDIDSRHALLMLDIDGFKEVNDILGHGAGDSVLIEIADSLRASLRRNDLIGRLGGDEFLIFVYDINNDNAIVNKAKQICSIAHKTINDVVQISGSVGIAVSSRDGMTFDTLYKNADRALYQVKKNGKNDYAFYGDIVEK